jgi:hypothetical protein
MLDRSQQRVIEDADNAIMASVIEKERAKPKPKKDEKAGAVPAKPKRIGSKTWDYTRARYIGGDC